MFPSKRYSCTRLKELAVAAVSQEKPGTSQGQAADSVPGQNKGKDPGQNGARQDTVTITLPSMASLPPLPPVQLEPKRLLWLGGLAALGVVGVLEWPVVAVVGVGSYVAERFARDEMRKSLHERR